MLRDEVEDCPDHRILNDGTRRRVDKAKYFCERSSDRVRARPAGQGLRDDIQIGHATGDVRAHDCGTNRIEGELRAPLPPCAFIGTRVTPYVVAKASRQGTAIAADRRDVACRVAAVFAGTAHIACGAASPPASTREALT